MKKKIDTYLIYFSYLFEAIDVISWGAFSTYVSTHSIPLSQAGKPIYGKIGILLTINDFTQYLWYVLMALYILFIVIKLKNREPINIMKNAKLSLVILVVELVRVGFVFHIENFTYLNSLRFMYVVLLTTLILYLKDRKYVKNGVLIKV